MIKTFLIYQGSQDKDVTFTMILDSRDIVPLGIYIPLDNNTAIIISADTIKSKMEILENYDKANNTN